MKPINLFKLTLFAVFITGIPSCTKDDDCSDLKGPVYYNAKVIDFRVGRIDKRGGPNGWTYYFSSDTVNANGDLIIYLRSENERLAYQNNATKGGLFINTAYACEPNYRPRTNQDFVSLTITSTENYDADHPAGSNLIDLFVTNGENGVDQPNTALTQHLASNSDYFIVSPSYVKFNKSPDNISRHTLIFELVLSDTTFNFQTAELTLK